MSFGSGGNTKAKAWKDIWGTGQGIGAVEKSTTVAELVGRLKAQFDDACQGMNASIATRGLSRAY